MTAQAVMVGGHEAAVRPIDLVHLAKQTLGDQALEKEVLRLFLTQSRSYASRAFDAASAEERAVAIHTIKGSARNIGAWMVADIAEDIEDADDGLKARKMDELGHALQDVCGFIEDMLAE